MNKSMIHIGNSFLQNCGDFISTVSKASSVVIITDSNVAPLYLDTLKTSLESKNFKVLSLILPAGESIKSLKTYEEALEFLSENEITRQDLLVALGGGAIGDLTGFVASTYLRGINFVQVPTTLLSMVDSSIGGKTGLNLKHGKNLCGSFYQPLLIIDDIATLDTLPPLVFKDGLSEVVKYGILQNTAIIDLLDSYKENITLIIEESINTKLKYCQDDEHDFGKRHFLNLGHTIGHAIESASDFEISHGSAVSIGTCMLLRALVAFGELPESTAKRIEDLYMSLGLPTSCDLNYETIYSYAIHDKKRNADSVEIIVPLDIGNCEIRTIDLSELKNIIRLGVK